VATFDQKTDAEGLKCVLLQEDMPAEIKDETNLQRFWFMVEPRAGYHVQVPSQLLYKAHSILNRNPAAEFMRKAVRCPSCDSSRIQYPTITRKNLLPSLVTQVMVMLHIMKHKYYCEDCHYTWLKTPRRMSRRHKAHTTPAITTR
jgi:transposase-like protein